MELRGKTALVTGATGGLGRAIARSLAERGSTLVLSSRKADELADLAASLPGEGHRTVVADLADEGAAQRLLAEAGEIDVLVANAGLPGRGLLDSHSPEYVEAMLRVNLEVPVQMARALAPGWSDRGSGHLVFISSLAGKAASPRGALYAASKFGLRGFALSLRQDLAGRGVGVSVVLPGFIRDAGMFADAGSKSPTLGTAAPEEVGEAVAEAIERDRAEVEVAPLRLRLLVAFAHRRPQLAARLSRRLARR